MELHAAIKGGNPAVVRDLLGSGADPEAVVTTKDGDSQVVAAVLHTAVDDGNLEMVRILLDAGAEPNVSSDGANGKYRITGTALHIAISRQHLGIVQLLLKMGADTEALEVMIEGTREIRRTALFPSAKEGWLEGVRALPGAGPTPKLFPRTSIESGGLWSALHAAAAKGQAGVVLALLEAGTALDALTNEHGTALRLARSRSHDSCVVVLEEAERGESSHCPPRIHVGVGRWGNGVPPGAQSPRPGKPEPPASSRRLGIGCALRLVHRSGSAARSGSAHRSGNGSFTSGRCGVSRIAGPAGAGQPSRSRPERGTPVSAPSSRRDVARGPRPAGSRSSPARPCWPGRSLADVVQRLDVETDLRGVPGRVVIDLQAVHRDRVDLGPQLLPFMVRRPESVLNALGRRVAVQSVRMPSRVPEFVQRLMIVARLRWETVT